MIIVVRSAENTPPAAIWAAVPRSARPRKAATKSDLLDIRRTCAAGDLQVEHRRHAVISEGRFGTAVPMKLVSIPANPVPENFVTGMLKTPDGVSLRYARWQPPAGRRGTVCILQGRTEWIEKYFETVRDLRARGFAVATLDWRGQGLSDRALSDRRKGYVRDFSEYDSDLETFMREIVLPDCPPPIFAIGHSTGATVLIRAAYRGHRWFDRMVLIAPLIALEGIGATATAMMIVRVMRMAGFGAMYVPRREYRRHGNAPLRRQCPDFRSRALCPQRGSSGGGARARARRSDGRLGRCGFPRHARDSRARLCVAYPPADAHCRGRARRHRVECGDRGFRHFAAHRLASRRGRRPA